MIVILKQSTLAGQDFLLWSPSYVWHPSLHMGSGLLSSDSVSLLQWQSCQHVFCYGLAPGSLPHGLGKRVPFCPMVVCQQTISTFPYSV